MAQKNQKEFSYSHLIVGKDYQNTYVRETASSADGPENISSWAEEWAQIPTLDKNQLKRHERPYRKTRTIETAGGNALSGLGICKNFPHGIEITQGAVARTKK